MKKTLSIGILLLIFAGSFSTSAQAVSVWVGGTPTVAENLGNVA